MRAIRTYSDLLDLVSTLLHRGVRNRSIHHREVQFRAVLTGTAGAGVLHRSGSLTAYATECLAEDARRAGRGCWLDVMLGAGADPFWRRWLEERLAPLAKHEVRVRILTERLD